MEQLNIKDLMIGDWVIATFAEYNYDKERVVGNQEPVKVKSIRTGSFRDFDGHKHYECFGIPLTKESLALNGFKEDSSVKMEYSDNSTCVGAEAIFLYPLTTSEDKKGVRMRVNRNLLSDISMRIGYLHELQHIFKLFGIEKEWEVE